MPCASTGVSPAACAHGMKPFIGFETGAGASLSVVHWAVAADEALADRVAPTSPAVAGRAMAIRVNVLIARSFQSVLRLGTGAAWARRVGPARSVGVCDLGLHGCQVKPVVINACNIKEKCFSK